jgi:hypothetical protein
VHVAIVKILVIERRIETVEGGDNVKEASILAKTNIGTIFRCSGGCIHLRLPGITLHLSEFQFISVSGLMQEGAERLVGESLQTLLKSKEEGGDG